MFASSIPHMYELKLAEICFLASSLNLLNVHGRHLGNHPRDKEANSARCKARWPWWRKGSTCALRPEGLGMAEWGSWKRRCLWLSQTLPRETRYGKLKKKKKKTPPTCDYEEKKKLDRIFSVRATSIPLNYSWITQTNRTQISPDTPAELRKSWLKPSLPLSN